MENPTFKTGEFKPGFNVILDVRTHKFPLIYASFKNCLIDFKDIEDTLEIKLAGVYGFIQSGSPIIENMSASYIGRPGAYFSMPGNDGYIGNDQASGILILLVKENKYKDFSPMLHFGQVEKQGRLKYIDGCMDSLLIAPVKKGYPCLNALYFPQNINQTQHTHPSHRIGLVHYGKGECLTPFGNLPLIPANIFVIKEHDGTFHTGLDGNSYPSGQHSFRTDPDSEMVVIAFHPDSDFGPEDEFHPMLNRTEVYQDGKMVSANQIDSIRTK